MTFTTTAKTSTRRLVLLLATAAALTGCATATGPQFTSVQVAAPDAANVYVYRRDRLFASGQSFNVSLDQKPMGSIANASFLLLSTTPGKHTVTILPGMGPTFPLEMNLEAGKTYFAEFDLNGGLLANPFFIGSKLVERTQEQGVGDLKVLKASK